MKQEHIKGPKAQENLERTMRALFQVSKAEMKDKMKPKCKRKRADKG